MKIKIKPDQHADFLRAAKLAESVAQGRTTLPVLSATLVTAKDGKVAFTANNLDEAVISQFEAETIGEGQVGISAKDLARIGAMKNTLEIESSEKGVIIRANGVFKLPSLDPSEFQALPDVTTAESFKFTPQELLKALATVYAASDPKDNRYQLQGVCLNLASKQGVATDGRRLALSSYPPAKDWKGTLIPDKACRMMLSLLKEGKDEEITCSIAQVVARFSCSGINFYTRLIEGTYPPFQNVLPKEGSVAKVNREALLEALDSFAFVEWDVRKIKVTLEKKEGTIHGIGRNTSDAQVTFPIISCEKKSEFQIDPLYLRQAIDGIADETVSLEFVDEFTPLVVKGDSYALVLLMRVAK